MTDDVALDAAYLSLPGQPIDGKDLRGEKARALFTLLEGDYPFATVLGAWQLPSNDALPSAMEAVLLDVEVEVSQRPVNDIHRVERIAVLFAVNDTLRPEPVALRADFPYVPHLNVTRSEGPRSLCLSDQPYEDERLKWTPSLFVEILRTWLARSAAGNLHQNDQPLEPLLGGAYGKILLPTDLLQPVTGAPVPLLCRAIDPGGAGDTRLIIVAEQEQEALKKSADTSTALPFVALVLGVGQPMTHGLIRWEPSNLSQLHQFLLEAGKDLLSELRTILAGWHDNKEMLERKPIFVISLPKRRTDDGPVEAIETWAFFAAKKLSEIQLSLGVHAQEQGFRGLLLSQDTDKQGDDVSIEMLLPYYALTPEDAAQRSGFPAADTRSVVAVGMGALGSQVFTNLYRGGFGTWTLVDSDHLLPHNLVRHQLDGNAIGHAKVVPLAFYANKSITGSTVATPLIADVLSPGANTAELTKAYTKANLVLDMSASVAVARHLARDLDDVPARRMSLFLNPTGAALVLIAEDAGRRHRLDVLEMQYYRSLTHRPDLTDHLTPPDGRIRYGRSCRDVSTTLSQDYVALFSAVGSRAVRSAVASPFAQVRIWKSDAADLSVSSITVPVYATEEMSIGNWTLVNDASLLERVKDLRASKLPVETGGVLLGYFDMQRRIVYVADLIASPKDSVERNDLYIRGVDGLREGVDRASAATAGWLRYIGEWHSHPKGVQAHPSADDRKLFDWLKELVAPDGVPPLMLICGEDEHRWFLGEMNIPVRNAMP